MNKKNAVLFVLFILPIVAYLFFASGVNGYTKLPIHTKKIADINGWKSLSGERISLDKKITILGFAGTEVLKNRGNLFNLNQKIYQRYHDFKDLQFVIIVPLGTENDCKKILDALDDFTDVSQWKFVFATPQEIQKFYTNLKVRDKLGTDFGTPNVYIVDKDKNLRGRKKDKKRNIDGYNTFHPSDLSNEMLDDFKVILYEYRAALKKNHNASKQL
jgi:hypothetical protein